jgi:hypothetical protein
MSARRSLAAFAFLATAAALPAADLAKIPRTIAKEPAYATKAPQYLLLVFGPDASERVWVVLDGDTLYVDRNGNGDLTDSGEAVACKKRPGSDSDEDGRGFEVGELTVGGRTHKGLVVGTMPLAKVVDDVRNRPHARQLLRADPKTQVVMVSLELRHPKLKGAGIDGRVPVQVGPVDLDGFLVFAARPQDAPLIHPDGPLQVTFFADKPTLQIGRETDVVLTVGAPGLGRGTFTMLAYDKTIPATAHPTVEVAYPPAKGTDPPPKGRYELTDRC